MPDINYPYGTAGLSESEVELLERAFTGSVGFIFDQLNSDEIRYSENRVDISLNLLHNIARVCLENAIVKFGVPKDVELDRLYTDLDREFKRIEKEGS